MTVSWSRKKGEEKEREQAANGMKNKNKRQQQNFGWRWREHTNVWLLWFVCDNNQLLTVKINKGARCDTTRKKAPATNKISNGRRWHDDEIAVNNMTIKQSKGTRIHTANETRGQVVDKALRLKVQIVGRGTTRTDDNVVTRPCNNVVSHGTTWLCWLVC